MSTTEPVKIAREILKLFEDPPRTTTVGGAQIIALDGRSGSGKTSITKIIHSTDPRVRTLAIENFYRGWQGIEIGPLRLAREVLRPWAAGLPARARHWDWNNMSWQTHPRTITPPEQGARVVIEGCGAGARALDPFLAGIVWLEADSQTRFERAIARDGETFAPHWDEWALQEHQMLQRDQTPQRAHRVFQL